MQTTISATELAKNLSDVLNRVRYRGERFIVERNGEPVATLAPPGGSPAVTVGDVFDLLRRMGVPDDDFADDLEAIQDSQPKVEFPEWPS